MLIAALGGQPASPCAPGGHTAAPSAGGLILTDAFHMPVGIRFSHPAPLDSPVAVTLRVTPALVRSCPSSALWKVDWGSLGDSDAECEMEGMKTLPSRSAGRALPGARRR